MTKRILAVLVVLLLAGHGRPGGGLRWRSAQERRSQGRRRTSSLQKELDERVADFETQYAGQIPDKSTEPDEYKQFQQDVLEYMITYELASQKAEELKHHGHRRGSPEGDRLDPRYHLRWRPGQVRRGPQPSRASPSTSSSRSYKESMLLQKVYDEVTKDVTTVPDSDIQAYYDEHKTTTSSTRRGRRATSCWPPIAGRVDGTTSTTRPVRPPRPRAADSSSTTGTAATTTTAPSSTTTTAAPTEADWNTALETAKKVRADLVARSRLDGRGGQILRRPGLQGHRRRSRHHLQGRDGPGVRGRGVLPGEGRDLRAGQDRLRLPRHPGDGHQRGQAVHA